MTYDQSTWVHQFEALPTVQNLSLPDVAKKFSSFLQEEWATSFDKEKDSLHYSPGYYIFTGRKGAWIYWHNQTACVVCLHPNLDNHLLIYPAIGKDNRAIHTLLSIMPPFKGNIQIARIPAALSAPHLFRTTVPECVKSTLETETVLDWQYPVHIISTEDVSALAGKRFYYARRKCKKFDSDSFSLRPFNTQDIPALETIGRIYSDVFTRTYPEFFLSSDEVYRSHADMLRIALANRNIMHGKTILYKENPVGLFIWDEIGACDANSLWFVFNRDIADLGYMQIKIVCGMLAQRGIKRLNLGGSETEGMDFYKTRFRPVQSIPMQSASLTYVSDEKLAHKHAA